LQNSTVVTTCRRSLHSSYDSTRQCFPNPTHNIASSFWKEHLVCVSLNDECTQADQQIDYTSHSNFCPVGHVTSDNTSSDASFRRATQWLQNCTEQHENCNTRREDSTWYPTRLLDLGNCDGDPSFARLIQTTEEPPVSPYITLSHCWGGTRPLQLTRQTASQPQPAFLIQDMPRTFQDALQVSKSLAIQYLWIDSLCIIQDEDDL
jgi:hypothetical protein